MIRLLLILALCLPASAAITATYQGQTYDATSNVLTRTLAAMPIGTASADRKVIAVCGFNPRNSLGVNVTSITIGGQSATILYLYNTPTSGFMTNHVYAIASVPTGTTADVVVTASNVWSAVGCATYSLTGSSSTANDTFQVDGGVTANVDVNAGGTIIGLSSRGSTSGTNITWTGLTSDVTVVWGLARVGLAHLDSATIQTVGVESRLDGGTSSSMIVTGIALDQQGTSARRIIMVN